MKKNILIVDDDILNYVDYLKNVWKPKNMTLMLPIQE